MEPRLSIGLPVRNGAAHLPATLDALLGQTWGDFELLVSDNASDDGTADVCAAYAKADPRLRVLRQPANLGANENYNIVARAGRGELFKWAAHDDVCAPDYLRTCVDLLDAVPEAVVAHTEPLLIDVDGAPLRRLDDGFVQPDGVRVRRPDPPVAARGLSSASPGRRFAGVLLDTVWVFEIFGVMRAAALRSTVLQEPFYGTDKVLVAEMALRGTIVASEEPLWRRRCHGGTTTNLDILTKTAWSDPHSKPAPPSVQMLNGYVNAVRRSPLGVRDQATCYTVVARKAATARPAKLAREVVATARARRAIC